VCTFSSLYAYINMNKQATAGTLKNFASDYCTNLNDVEISKISFFSTITSYEPETEEEFLETCVNEISNMKYLNSWIDPLIPSEEISLETLCSNLHNLYK
jgi:hypothetical protein